MERRIWLLGVFAGLTLGASTGGVWRLSRRPDRGPVRAARPEAQAPADTAAAVAPDTAASIDSLPAADSAPPPAPPPTLQETVPPAPGSNYVWVEGRWVWRAAKKKFEWQPGYWQPTPPVFIARAGWAAVLG
jgi:WXXGXW repeat (2 copies)